MKKRKLMLAVACLFSGASAFAATHLIVDLRSGESYEFLLKEKPVITYESGDLVVNGNAATSYAIAKVKNYHFEDLGAGVPSVEVSHLRIVPLDENTLQVENAPQGVDVVLNSMAGALQAQTKVDTDGVATVTLPQAKGIYLLSVGKQTFKVIRK